MRSWFLVLLWASYACCQLPDDYNKLADELFGDLGTSTPSSTTTKKSNLNPNQGSDTPGECYTLDGKPGVCVAHYQCSKNNTVIINGASIITPRAGSDQECPHYLQVCCLLDDRRPRPPPPVVQPKSCGWTNPGATFRMTNKQNYAEYGEYPWMVAVLMRTVGNGAWSRKEFLGGGSIIHPQVVLTTAHKINDKSANELKCRAGEWDIQTNDEDYDIQERDVRKIVKHPDFKPAPMYNDVALLFLESPYTLANAPHIGVACVAPVAPPDGARCESMGWGALSDKTDTYAVILKKVQLPWVAPAKCQALLRRSRLGRFFQLHESLTCAGGVTAEDTCIGDGGSPLICPIENDTKSGSNRYAIFGLVAFGVGCGEPNTPGVYTNVPLLYQWIGQKMAGEGFPATSYTYN